MLAIGNLQLHGGSTVCTLEYSRWLQYLYYYLFTGAPEASVRSFRCFAVSPPRRAPAAPETASGGWVVSMGPRLNTTSVRFTGYNVHANTMTRRSRVRACLSHHRERSASDLEGQIHARHRCSRGTGAGPARAASTSQSPSAPSRRPCTRSIGALVHR